jgi:hypothetical protein
VRPFAISGIANVAPWQPSAAAVVMLTDPGADAVALGAIAAVGRVPAEKDTTDGSQLALPAVWMVAAPVWASELSFMLAAVLVFFTVTVTGTLPPG